MIEYTTWRWQRRPAGASPADPARPVWVEKNTYTRPVPPERLREFNQLLRQNSIRARGLGSSNL
jgi:hypothetical protein